MKKNFRKSLAAIACAAVMATQMAAMPVSAIAFEQSYYYYYNGIYYSRAEDAAAVGGDKWVKVSSLNMSDNCIKLYYDSVKKKFYTNYEDALSAGVSIPSIIYLAGNPGVTGKYYSSVTGKYYTSFLDALNASNGDPNLVTFIEHTSAGYYYSSYTNRYYYTYAEALAASNGIASYVSFVSSIKVTSSLYYSEVTNGYYTTYSAALRASMNSASKVREVKEITSPMYYSYVTDAYYTTYAYALEASNGEPTKVTYVGYNILGYVNLPGADVYGYRYYYNGKFYTSLSAAQAAGGIAVGVDIALVPYYSNYYYYNGIYGYYGYADGYLAYLKNLFNKNTVTSEKATDGVPHLYGNTKKAGWALIEKYIGYLSKGDTLKIDMNGATEIDRDILKAIDGKNVNLQFVLDNGAVWTINGRDVSKATDLNILTEYNIDYIPSGLVKLAKKDCVASAQIGISSSFDDLGVEASVTVKFAKKRAGCTAVVYRYNKERNSLQCVDKAKVLSNGKCTFEVEDGGAYIIVLK